MSTESNGSKANESGPTPARPWRRLALAAGEHYIRGLIVLGIAYGLWRAVQALSSRFGHVGTRPTVILVLAILFVPPVLGWLVRRLLHPWMKRVHLLRAVLRGEDRFVAEFAPDSRRGYPVALLSWPNERVRSWCVITATYPGPEPGRELAAVYLPRVPDVHRGAVRVVALDDLEVIDWQLAECLRLHVTFGTQSPGYLHKP